MAIEIMSILFAVCLSYLVSYVRDLRRIVAIGIRVWPSLRTEALAVGLSFICRSVLVVLAYGTLTSLHSIIPILNQTALLVAIKVPALALASGLAVSGSGVLLFDAAHEYGEQNAHKHKRDWNPLMRQVLRSEKLGWRALVGDLESRLSRRVHDTWKEHANHTWAIHTLFEDCKKEIIDTELSKPLGNSRNLWIFYALVTGDKNVKKLEGLFWTIGISNTLNELERLVNRERVSPNEVQKDVRKCPRKLYNEIVSTTGKTSPTTIVNKLLDDNTSHRRGERHVGHIIAKDPAVLSTYVRCGRRR